MSEPGRPSSAGAGAGAGGTRTSVVLVGMMGAGKTAVGKRLARRLRWRLLDSDRQVEARAGAPVPEIFRRHGEDAFRRMESEVLAEALASDGPTIVAAAGGVVLDEGNRRLLRDHGGVVWLSASVETLVARVHNGRGRPLLAADLAGTLARLDAERRPLYEEIADLVIDVSNNRPADRVADEIIDELGLVASEPARGGGGSSSPHLGAGRGPGGPRARRSPS